MKPPDQLENDSIELRTQNYQNRIESPNTARTNQDPDEEQPWSQTVTNGTLQKVNKPDAAVVSSRSDSK